MSMITVIWPSVAAACLTLGIMHLLVWRKRRGSWSDLLFFLAAAGAAGLIICELLMLRARTPEEYNAMLRLFHIPAWLTILALVGFVRLHLRAGRLWLAWTICILRSLSLLFNFLTGQNANYLEVTSLRSVPFLGESASVAEGIPNPFALFGTMAMWLFVIFIIDATITVWRRGERRQALTIGVSIMIFVLMGVAQGLIVLLQIAAVPVIIGPTFIVLLAVMSYELSRDVILAAQMADNLLESEERMALASEAAKLGFWDWDITQDLVRGSEQWFRLFGFESGKAVSLKAVMQRIHPEDRETVEQEVQRSLRDRLDYAGEYRVILPDGSERWISACGRLHSEAGKPPVRMLGTAMDITKHKEDDIEMSHLRLELVHLARVTTMNACSGFMAHEINQPLGAILNNASAARLLLGDEREDISEILSDIAEDARRADNVLRKIRGMVRKCDVHIEPLQINELIEETVDLLNPFIRSSQTRIQLDLKPDLATVNGDRIRLQQVLLNLAINAIHSMAGMPNSVLRISSAMETPDRVLVRVIYSGTGLEEADTDTVFKPYFTTKKDGLGLGLAICRTIIEEHGGRILAENHPDGGAVFSFTLNVWKGESE